MRYQLVDGNPKTFVLVFETNDELAGELTAFASEQQLSSASFKPMGAPSFAKLGRLNWQTKQYELSAVLNEQMELLSLIGDVALKDDEPQARAHAIVGQRDGTALHSKRATALLWSPRLPVHFRCSVVRIVTSIAASRDSQ